MSPLLPFQAEHLKAPVLSEVVVEGKGAGHVTAPKVGLGSVYEFTAQDGKGEYLDGGQTHKVTLPGPVQLQCAAAPLRPARSLFRPDLETWRFRAGQV